MIVGWGNFFHAQNEVGVTIDGQALLTQAGTYYSQRVRWNCKGDLLGLNGIPFTTQEQITIAINNLINAYAVNGNNLVLYLNDGVTPTAHQLISNNCIGGTRVIQAPSFPTYAGDYQPGYGRGYTFSVEGDVALTGQNVAIKFQEFLSEKGTGGPVTVWIPVAQGPYIKQQTSEQSTFKVIQHGSCVGLYDNLEPPPPMFPEDEIEQERDVQYGGPERLGRYDFPTTWSYTFESTGGLDGGDPTDPDS